jgi:hypothetical protein
MRFALAFVNPRAAAPTFREGARAAAADAA